MLRHRDSGVVDSGGRRVEVRQSCALEEDHAIQVARGTEMFVVGDRVQLTDNGLSRKEKDAGLVNGGVGTLTAIDTSSGKPGMMVELDTAKSEQARRLSFLAGPDREAGEFKAVRHGHAGKIHKGRGGRSARLTCFIRMTGVRRRAMWRWGGRWGVTRSNARRILLSAPTTPNAARPLGTILVPGNLERGRRINVNRNWVRTPRKNKPQSGCQPRRLRGQQVSGGRGKRGGEPQAADTERDQTWERRRAQRGEPMQDEPTRNCGHDREP